LESVCHIIRRDAYAYGVLENDVFELVTHAGISWIPTHIAFVLLYPVSDPIEMHIHGFGAFLKSANICSET
jgi:hypothetical protein